MFALHFPAYTKHLYNINIRLDQRRRRWSDVCWVVLPESVQFVAYLGSLLYSDIMRTYIGYAEFKDR